MGAQIFASVNNCRFTILNVYSFLTKLLDQRCINCGINHIGNKHQFSSFTLRCQEILKQWISYDDLDKCFICHSCTVIIQKCLADANINVPERKFGHSHVCIGCGRSIANKRNVKLKQEEILYVVKHWPQYNILEIPDKNTCCYACTLSIRRIIEKEVNSERGDYDDIDSTTNMIETTDIKAPDKCIRKMLDKTNRPRLTYYNNVRHATAGYVCNIVLTNGKRTACSSSRCVYVNCKGSTRKRIPRSKQRLIASTHNIFLTSDCRVCIDHQSFADYTLVPDINRVRKLKSNFTIPQFEGFVNEIKQGMVVIDFENIEAMADNICEYWTGIKVAKFMQIFEELNKPKLMKSALAAYLIRGITGDSVQKLSKLFNMSSAKLKKQVKFVEDQFCHRALQS